MDIQPVTQTIIYTDAIFEYDLLGAGLRTGATALSLRGAKCFLVEMMSKQLYQYFIYYLFIVLFCKSLHNRAGPAVI